MLRFSFGNTPNHTLVFLYQINSTALHVTLCTQTHPQLTTLSGCPTDRQTDRERKHCSNKQQFPWQLWGKTGEAAIGWQAGSGRTMSEGLKGFPWPLMPPEILKPRPGFFSILTHSYRERRERYRKKRKDKTTTESEIQSCEKSPHRQTVTRQHVEVRSCVTGNMFWHLCCIGGLLWSNSWGTEIFAFCLDLQVPTSTGTLISCFEMSNLI